MTRPDLLLPDDRLLAECRIDLYRGSGPGGQKRNKTSNAVRITHLPTGHAVTATESRSLRENRLYALRRIRLRLAANEREPVDPLSFQPPDWLGQYISHRQLHIHARNPHHPQAAALLLDLLDACHANPAAAAANLGISTSSYLRFLAGESALWTAANDLRTHWSEPPLTKPK